MVAASRQFYLVVLMSVGVTSLPIVWLKILVIPDKMEPQYSYLVLEARGLVGLIPSRSVAGTSAKDPLTSICSSAALKTHK